MPSSEIETKLARVRSFLAERGLRSALFNTPGNFAWITGGGRNHVSVSGDHGVGAIVVTSDEAFLLANNIELARLQEEEHAIGFTPREYSWWGSGSLADEIPPFLSGLVSDVPGDGAPLLPRDGIALRNPLLPEEVRRYRQLGEDVGMVLTHAAFHCRPGLSEQQLAGMIAGPAVDLGMDPLVTLAAVDERVRLRRHPLPTDRRLQQYALLVLTARRGGLHVSASRLVHFGPIPQDLLRRSESCARVDAALLHATRVGSRLCDVFEFGEKAYAAEGYSGEWEHHHQGGPTGYNSRDLKATPFTNDLVLENQAFAWNPTIAGTKSEDTFLVTRMGVELLSPTPDLPSIEVEVAGQVYARPAILER